MIKRLVIKDCLGIEELAISPGKVNVISGGNEKGKTSILETIEKALFNTKRRAKFVRAGAEKAYIELETDNGIQIRRTVVEDEAGLDKGSVKVTQDGHPVKAPETFLKELFGITTKKDQQTFAFNPVDFMQKKDTEQTDILLALMPIRVTAEDIALWFGEHIKLNYDKHGLQVLKDAEQWFYDARQEANARVKAVEDECEAVAKRLPDNYQVEDWESVNLGKLFNDLRQTEELNHKIQDNQKFINDYDQKITDILNKYVVLKKDLEETNKTALDDLDKQIRELEKRKARLQGEMGELSKSIDKERKKELEVLEQTKESAETFLRDNQPKDIASLIAQCEEAEKMKAYIPLAKEVKNLNTRLVDEQNTAMRYDNCVTAARKKPHELLAKVKLPVEGLGIDGKGIVTINDLPLSNLSTAQQVRACLDIARALAKNTALKLICIDKIEHLDETVRAEFLKQIESDEGFQYFVTEVTDGELKVEMR